MIPMVKPNPATRLARVDSDDTRLPRIRSGNSGSAATRCRRTNSPPVTRLPSNSTTVDGAPQPVVSPRVNANSKAPTPAASNTAPATSIRWATRRACSGWNANATRHNNPLGMLTKNAHRHERLSTKSPPAKGPITLVPANTRPV